jgi:hypothetical protein
LFEMTHGLCSCHSEQSEESFSILRVMVIENEPLPHSRAPGHFFRLMRLSKEYFKVIS